MLIQRPMGFSPSVIATRCQLPHQVEPGIGVTPCLPLMRKGSARHVALTEGENYIRFEILNQWISKRGLEISLNRIETQNPCPLNLWGHGFVISFTAAAGNRHCRQHGSYRKRAQPATTESTTLKLMGSWIRRIQHGSSWKSALPT